MALRTAAAAKPLFIWTSASCAAPLAPVATATMPTAASRRRPAHAPSPLSMSDSFRGAAWPSANPQRDQRENFAPACSWIALTGHGRARRMLGNESAVNGSSHDVTELLQAWSAGDVSARDRLMPLVYRELRRRAAARLWRER